MDVPPPVEDDASTKEEDVDISIIVDPVLVVVGMPEAEQQLQGKYLPSDL